ncbi:hypothetical protein JW921_08420 [Candidatus Fermentibacterales bacterium]|nr:hypothetical protein [Candidatus Fermentibacterales bacterium]
MTGTGGTSSGPVSPSSGLIALGVLERAQGLRGRLILRLELVGGARPLPEGLGVTVGDRPFRIASCSLRDTRRVLIELEGVRSREAAEDLAGRRVLADRADVSPPGFAAVPLDLLRHLTLVDRALGPLRTVDLEGAGDANPLLIVEGGGKRFPVPVCMVLARAEIDWSGMEARLELPEGLTDLDP